MMKFAPLIILMSAGTPLLSEGAEPADSVEEVRELEAVTVMTLAPRKVLRISSDGAVNISVAQLGEQVTLMGSGDPLAVVRSLPSVATANDLQATVNVRGASSGDNLFLSDNARVVNPLHMLGLFSAFNPAFYNSYGFRAGRVPMTTGSQTSGCFSAESGMEPDSVLRGSISTGLIESHAGVKLPVGRNFSVSAGVRQTYLNAVFPRLLTLDDSHLGYDFTDVNIAAVGRLGVNDVVRLSYFGNRDRLTVDNDINGSKEGRLGWNNSAASATWLHDSITTYVTYSDYSNKFDLDEGGRHLHLPSYFREFKAATTVPMGRLTLGADISHRRISGQNGFGRAQSMEYNLAAEYTHPVGRRVNITAGLRLAAYKSGASHYWRPQPRVEFTVDLGKGFGAYAAVGRRVMFDRLIEETTAGLPADYRTLAGNGVEPGDIYEAEAGVRGTIGESGANFSAEVYARRMRHAIEWGGSLIDLASPDYNPQNDILDGRGYAAGISLSAMRQIGRVRGRVGYNYGRSRVKISRFGDRYCPSAHDRPHDLTASANYNPIAPLTISASFTYASGTPYTRAKYGYMIGENLICEYFPHNSSRLPAYKRLDLAASWRLRRGARYSHVFTVSVYNALASRNVLFRFVSYSMTEGIQQRESVMKALIPSVSYTFSF